VSSQYWNLCIITFLFEINITRQHLFGKIMSAMTQHPFKTKRKK